MIDKRAQIGTTITWLGAAAIVMFIMTIYMIGVIAIKTTMGEIQREVINNDGLSNDEILTKNVQSIILLEKTPAKEIVERICKNYYLKLGGESTISNIPAMWLQIMPLRSINVPYFSNGKIEKTTIISDEYCQKENIYLADKIKHE